MTEVGGRGDGVDGDVGVAADTGVGVGDPHGAVGAYCLCDLARTSRDFAVVDLASGEVSELETEEDVRAVVDRRYPGARFRITIGRSVIEDEDLGQFVILVAFQEDPNSRNWKPVASAGGAVHGPRCVPFSPEIWPEAADDIGLSSPGSSGSSPGSQADLR